MAPAMRAVLLAMASSTTLVGRRTLPVVVSLATCAQLRGSRSKSLESLLKRGDISRFAEHLVDLAGVQLLRVNHLTSVLLQHDRMARDAGKQLPIKCQGFRLGFE